MARGLPRPSKRMLCKLLRIGRRPTPPVFPVEIIAAFLLDESSPSKKGGGTGGIRTRICDLDGARCARLGSARTYFAFGWRSASSAGNCGLLNSALAAEVKLRRGNNIPSILPGTSCEFIRAPLPQRLKADQDARLNRGAGSAAPPKNLRCEPPRQQTGRINSGRWCRC